MPWPQNWLKQKADDLLGWDSAADFRGYCDAYDNLLWAVVTCDRDELGELVARLYDDPYINLPPPIQVAMFRLWGLEPPVDAERARAATAGIALYCSPGEEAGACGGLRWIAESTSSSMKRDKHGD
jgi:hypothetical protein